jgi:hypothetical protein
MHNTSSVQQPHRMAKRHAMDCGRPKCMLCGNRRKVFGEITFQEQKNTQDKFYQDDQLEDESNKD